MANKKLCRFCSTGFVPQRDEKICPTCSMEVSRAVSLPVGEPVILETAEFKVSVPSDITAVTVKIKENTIEDLEEELSKDEPEPKKPEVTSEMLKESIIKANPEPEIQKAILGESAPEPEPVIVEAAAPKSAEENRKQDAEVINPTED